jgi:hypothetical protein
MNRINTALEKFGLSDNEIKVYVEALKHAQTSPYELAKFTGIPRTSVYDILTALALKGLVELSQSDGLQKQQTKIKAKNPSYLRNILWQKRSELIRTETDIIEILPELKGFYHKQEANADFQFYPGIDGVKKVTIEEDDGIDLPLLAWDKLMPMDIFGSEQMDKSVAKDTKQRLEMKHKIKELIPLNDWTKHVLSYQIGRDPEYLTAREVRAIDNPIFNQITRISIKDTRIRITCAENEEVWGIVINSKALSQSLAALFQLTWQLATPVTHDIVKSWGKNEFSFSQ